MTKSEYILGIQIGHDASAAVIDHDGKILAAIGEERLSRKKKHFGVLNPSHPLIFQKSLQENLSYNIQAVPLRH